MDLSVIVPVRNGANTIADQLAALTNQSYESSWEIVVVDNASTDATAEIVSACAKDNFRVRRAEAPLIRNLSYVRNVGVKYSRGNAIAFCDADDIVGPGWVGIIGRAVRSHPFVTGRKEYHTLNTQWVLRSRGLIQVDGTASIFGRPIASGSNFACQRWIWESVGGNDETLDCGEDADFSIRVSNATGIHPVFVPEAVVHYRLRHDLRGIFGQARRYGEGEVALYERHGRDADVKKIRIALRAYAGLAGLVPSLPLFRSARGRFAWLAGKRLGRLQGSIRRRTFYL